MQGCATKPFLYSCLWLWLTVCPVRWLSAAHKVKEKSFKKWHCQQLVKSEWKKEWSYIILPGNKKNMWSQQFVVAVLYSHMKKELWCLHVKKNSKKHCWDFVSHTDGKSSWRTKPIHTETITQCQYVPSPICFSLNYTTLKNMCEADGEVFSFLRHVFEGVTGMIKCYLNLCLPSLLL